jgi:methanogenic corrinoid protein MtbC1
MATAISVMALAHLFDETEVTTRLQRTVLVACVEGELHDFAARLAADALEHGGFTVRFLGASVPTDHLVRMLREDPPDLLVLTVTMAFNLPAARTAVARVREAMGDRVKIAVGGGALGGAAAGGLGADFTGADAGELVVEATQVLGGSR